MTNQEFIDKLYSFNHDDERAHCVDLCIEYLDGLLIARRFDECDEIFAVLDPEKLAGSVILSALGITRCFYHSKNRIIFYNKAIATMTKRKGKKYAAELLERFKPPPDSDSPRIKWYYLVYFVCLYYLIEFFNFSKDLFYCIWKSIQYDPIPFSRKESSTWKQILDKINSNPKYKG